MATSLDKVDVNRRLAQRAVIWYAAGAGRVEDILRTVAAQPDDELDFVAALVEAGVITTEQADRLRLDPAAVERPLPSLDDIPADLDEPNPTKLDVAARHQEDPSQLGAYRILRLLGQGGMGAVYLAFDAVGHRQVAIKVLAPDLATRQNTLRRFHLEGQHGAMLAHDNIVRSFDMGQDASTGLNYIVLEYVDGPTAQDMLEREGRLKVGDAVRVVLDIARALEHAHRKQIIHRDIKPANILLTSAGLAKLSDLGLAKRRDDTANLTNATQGIGTPYYMPYEQAMNAKKADERSDIYSLGATFYHLITGEVPFGGESSLDIVEKKGIGTFAPASSLNPDVPAKLDAILTRMLARDPDNRYQTASEAIVDLERSELAAAIPTFVNVDVAMQDPVVRQRLESPVAATQPDLQMQQALEQKQELWYLRFKDQRGNLCKSKANTAEILERLKKGTIPLHTEAARSPTGKFRALEKWPEFQSATAAAPIAKKLDRPRPPVDAERPELWWLIAAGAVGVAIVALLVVTVMAYLGQ